MRKITEKAVRAFNRSQPFKQGNTEVVVNHYAPGGTLTQMYLFDNLIAEDSDRGLSICDGGYDLSATTKERLRGLGADVYTQNKIDYLNGEEWDGSWRYIKIKVR